MNVYMFFMMWAFGFNQSTCTLVGKKIGQNDVVGAQMVSNLSYALTLGTVLIASSVIYLKLFYLSSILSDIPEILDNIRYDNTLGVFSLTFLICVAFIPDAMKYG